MNEIRETIKETMTQLLQGVTGLIIGVILYVAYTTYDNFMLQCIFLSGLYLIGRSWHSNNSRNWNVKGVKLSTKRRKVESEKKAS